VAASHTQAPATPAATTAPVTPTQPRLTCASLNAGGDVSKVVADMRARDKLRNMGALPSAQADELAWGAWVGPGVLGRRLVQAFEWPYLANVFRPIRALRSALTCASTWGADLLSAAQLLA